MSRELVNGQGLLKYIFLLYAMATPFVYIDLVVTSASSYQYKITIAYYIIITTLQY